ncbi:glycoside hydrolase family 88 protein [Sphingomonas floccifaciens]|uniref:Glycoside hydrolase family 88 protein n=1 Tax=Sphingomonas floccifaciens TaxID=1844115 RepID=A0ABW4NDB8_9SPHN
MTNIIHEPVRDRARFDAIAIPSAEAVDGAVDRALARVQRALPQFTRRYPAPSSEGGFYPAIDNVEWTNGFWTGELWLAWQLSGDDGYREVALAQARDFLDRAERRINVAHHDLGFLYTPSACAAWSLVGDEPSRRAGLMAAELLLERFDPVSGVIQAWGDLNDPEQAGRMIIDCNLNLPLLYWATALTGDGRFRDAAERHLTQAARHLVRPDASTFHTFHMDTRTGEPSHGTTHQGYADDSCWARGQAWGIYGFALGYSHSGRTELIELAATNPGKSKPSDIDTMSAPPALTQWSASKTIAESPRPSLPRWTSGARHPHMEAQRRRDDHHRQAADRVRIRPAARPEDQRHAAVHEGGQGDALLAPGRAACSGERKGRGGRLRHPRRSVAGFSVHRG